MICNFKSLIYVFKKVKNKKINDQTTLRQIIKIAEIEQLYGKISLKEIFEDNHYDKIFECYDVLVSYFYDRQNRNKKPSNIEKEGLEEWELFVFEKIGANIEYFEFFDKMCNEPIENNDKKFNLFKLIFW